MFMKNLINIIIKIGDYFKFPIIILVICLYLFEDILNNFRYINIIRYIGLFIVLLGIISGILEFINNGKKKS